MSGLTFALLALVLGKAAGRMDDTHDKQTTPEHAKDVLFRGFLALCAACLVCVVVAALYASGAIG